jgi:Leucine-rich repeat (LRR) protein
VVPARSRSLSESVANPFVYTASPKNTPAQPLRHGAQFRLNLNDTRISDAGLEALAEMDLPSLWRLQLTSCRITNAGVRHLCGERIKSLDLPRTQIGFPEIFHILGEFPNLSELWLDATSVRDEDLTQLRLLPNLEQLSLSTTTITDQGIGHLAACKKLKSLQLLRTKVTEAAVNRFKADHPHVDIQIRHGTQSSTVN